MTHLDFESTGGIDSEQETALKAAIANLIANERFEDVSFYLNGDYIGGRPNDRG